MKTLWITYAWADNVEGDFSYLTQQLRSNDVAAAYDRIALIPGQRLWDRIGERITTSALDGWAYLLTPNSLASEPCREELAYALDRALRTKGEAFPLIGLLHGVVMADVPPALRVRLCVSLRSPDWIEELKAGLEKRPPQVALPAQSAFVLRVHRGYGGDPSATAVEIRPRFGETMYWRMAVPVSASIRAWGHGPASGGAISFMSTMVVQGGTGEVNGVPMTWFGSGDKLSPAVSAYAVFGDVVPDFVGFGLASGPTDAPTNMDILALK